MWTDTQDGRKLVAEITYEVVGEVAPEEQEIFDELLQEYYQPAKPAARRDSDDPLGFGLEGVVSMATPAAAALVATFLNHLLDEAVKTFQDESVEAVKQKIAALFHRTKDKETAEDKSAAPAAGAKVEPAPVGFDRDQLAAILKAAKDEARKRGASKDEAEQMANALFVRLALT
jgi:hypothetical protein